MQENKIYQDEETINIRAFIFQYLVYWKWFVFSVFVVLALGVVYLKITPKQYQSEAKILLNEKDNSSLLLGLQELSSLGFDSNSKVDDQIEVLKSRRLMTKVVDKLDLNIQYYQKKDWVAQEVYKDEAFIAARFENEKTKYAVDTVRILDVEVVSPTQYICTEKEKDTQIRGTFGRPLKFPFGNLLLFRSSLAQEGDKTRLVISPITTTVLNYIESIDIVAAVKKGNVINLGLKSTLPDNSNKIIDLLITQYIEDLIDDRKQVGTATVDFINDRLSFIARDLGSADTNMEQYKSREKITDLVTEGEVAIQQSATVDNQLKQYSIQLSLVNYMDHFIRTNRQSLIPANIGLTDPSIAQATQEYNKLVLERNNLLKSSTEENPMVRSLNERIQEINTNLQASLRNYKTTTQIALTNVEKQANQMMGNISQLPVKERGFRDIVRKQQTVEALYLLLLQKREETEITTASTPNVVKIVDHAYYSQKPVAPKTIIVLLASGLLGLAIPFGVLYVRFLLDDKVHSRKEVEEIVKNIPITGYLPKYDERIIDIQNTNSSFAEAFRIIRTNINFLLPGDKNQPRSIFVTSTLSREGKSFVTVNLAFTLAFAKKKVLVLEADIRKPKIRKYLDIEGNFEGITEYLSDNIDDISKYIIKTNYKESGVALSIDVLPSGSKAPNPSELLGNGKFKEIIDYGLQNYDYVLVDTAPVGMVTDTLLINKYTDLMLYIVRANFLPKNMLEIPKRLKEEGKFNDHETAILLNGVDIYRAYGYGYGYGGYYGYGNEKGNKPWYKKLFS
ncbi:MAG: polysaccharide biosynthesis tyrosine autokinase [Flavobacteriaceae bacterium]|jgi:capsular exopolysaccharide synthesis family protein|nr:polysaccharide biosynthesis tyrosine autokinase [Flavobacteriaceae bacterium]